MGDSKSRERRTLLPSFDAEDLAKEIELESARSPSSTFDPASYARIVESRVYVPTEESGIAGSIDPTAVLPSRSRALRPTGGTTAASTIPSPPPRADDASDETLDSMNVETAGREMYSCYLESDFPAALVLAERVLSLDAEHSLAQLVAERCRERMRPTRVTLRPSSVLRRRPSELERYARDIDPASSLVLHHIDGVTDAATVAELSGLSGGEALERIVALVDLGVLEVVTL